MVKDKRLKSLQGSVIPPWSKHKTSIHFLSSQLPVSQGSTFTDSSLPVYLLSLSPFSVAKTY